MLADKLMSVVPSAASSRGLFVGGGNPTSTTVIDYIEISTPGNATDFGDCTATKSISSASNGSSDRAVWGGGYDTGGNYVNVIEYITISTPGNSSDFGDLESNMIGVVGTSNGTNDRGIFAGGYIAGSGTQSAIRYATISSTSNTTSFGNLINGYYSSRSVCSNGANERGVFLNGGGAKSRDIEYITISSTGDSADFGDLMALQGAGNAYGVTGGGGTSNLTGERGVYCCGQYSAMTNVIQYFTISTLGNASDFGDMTNAQNDIGGTTSGVTGDTAVMAPMDTESANLTIDYFTISTTGNSSDFGDLSVARSYMGIMSNAD